MTAIKRIICYLNTLLPNILREIFDMKFWVRYFPFNTTVKFSDGLSKLQHRDFQGAIYDFDAVLSRSESYEAYQNRGAAHYQLAQFREALLDFEAAIHLRPQQYEAYLGLAITYTRLENYQQALRYYNEALKHAPRHSMAYTNRGYVKFRLFDYSGALIDFGKAINLNAENAMAYSNRGAAYFKMNDASNAQKDWQKAAMMGFVEAQEMLRRHFPDDTDHQAPFTTRG